MTQGRIKRIHLLSFLIAVIITASIILSMVPPVNKATKESVKELTLNEAFNIIKIKLFNMVTAIEGNVTDVYYSITVSFVATPIVVGKSEMAYNLWIEVEGINYTRVAGRYTSIHVKGAAVGELKSHIAGILESGVLRGLSDWEFISSSLNISLDIGYALYYESKDILLIRLYLPVFHVCGSTGLGYCGSLFLNATFYLDDEKYVIVQYLRPNFTKLVEEGYMQINSIEKGAVDFVNPLAVIVDLDGVDNYNHKPAWLLEADAPSPIIVSVTIVTTNRTVLEEALRDLGVYRPLVEARLLETHVEELSAGENLSVDMHLYNKLLFETYSRGILEFVEGLRATFIRGLYGDIPVKVKLLEDPRSHAKYYYAEWLDTRLKASPYTLHIDIYNASSELVEGLVGDLLQCYEELTGFSQAYEGSGGVVDRPGFEPGASRVQAERSSRLSYRPAQWLVSIGGAI